MTKTKAPKVTFPYECTEAFAKVTIYRLAPTGGTIKYSVDYRMGGKRMRQAYANWAEAKLQAETIVHKLASGDTAVLQLTGDDSRIYVRATETLKPTAIALDTAAIRFAEAFKVLGSDMVLEACKEYAKRHPRNMPHKTVAEVVVEMLDAKRKGNLSAKHVKDLEYRCGALADVFVNTQIQSIATSDVRQYLENKQVIRPGQKSKNITARTFKNHVGALTNLFAFAKNRGYLPKDSDVMDAIELPKDVGGEIEIFSPDELALMLKHARTEFVPFLVIAAFAGVRSAELARLDWSDIRPDFIEIKAAKAKTASRRLVPICAALSAWLATYRRATGAVVQFDNLFQQIGWLTDTINAALKAQAERDGNSFVPFKWKRNALRHSYISYRVSETQDAAKVSLEAGNSPAMVFRHYRELVTPSEAAAWFAVLPQRPANVLPITQAAAAQ